VFPSGDAEQLDHARINEQSLEPVSRDNADADGTLFQNFPQSEGFSWTCRIDLLCHFPFVPCSSNRSTYQRKATAPKRVEKP
jgi:hypothetical protein